MSCMVDLGDIARSTKKFQGSIHLEEKNGALVHKLYSFVHSKTLVGYLLRKIFKFGFIDLNLRAFC